MALRLARLASVLCLLATSAAYAEPVGDAATVKNEVTGKIGAQVRHLNVGDNVSANELVKTGNESATLLRFLDNTSLNVGQQSTVVLDRFVVNPNSTTKEAVINMTTGAFRFVTGNSDPKNFTIKTKVLTLGIRG